MFREEAKRRDSWVIPADLLANSRFVVSPMHETVAALTMLQAPWRPRRGRTPGWMPDFVGLPPVGRAPSFEEELAQLERWDDADARRARRPRARGAASRADPRRLARGRLE